MNNHAFDEEHVLHKLKHFLPSQAPLKDFVHHNTLHAFQHKPFFEGTRESAQVFGYRVNAGLTEYRELYKNNKINHLVLSDVLSRRKGNDQVSTWLDRLLNENFDESSIAQVGRVRQRWKSALKVNMDKEVHPLLLRVISGFLDQGVSIWPTPAKNSTLLTGLKTLNESSYIPLFKSRISADLLKSESVSITNLLNRLVGNPDYYEHYLFDMLFAHPGWSGIVSFLEDNPESLLDPRSISLHDFVLFELLLENDALIHKFGTDYKPLGEYLSDLDPTIFNIPESSDLDEVYALWQEAFEWTYFDQVAAGLLVPLSTGEKRESGFQFVVCIDDRMGSLRTYLELLAAGCETFGTAGFFNLPFYFQPEHSKFHTKVCPAPITPGHLIKERDARVRHKRDAHFKPSSYGFFSGWLSTQTVGFWSALKMTRNILLPSESPAMVSSFQHMDPNGKLSVAFEGDHQDGLKVGFDVLEMADRFEGLLKSIGLVKDFSKLVYLVGHGASSVNNTYYAGYDCGACSGRAGSVNARVAAQIGNLKTVRAELEKRGILIPDATRFVGGLVDTTRDAFEFYDLTELDAEHLKLHVQNKTYFDRALLLNAKERSRRFLLVDSNQSLEEVHEKVALRALSLFEPRPEWNHATNALCLIGNRKNNKHLFLDRRAFLQSYDHSIDPEGSVLLGILKAVTPVCGGINLEYYFSRVDNARLGAGSKLPHNVVGLIGVSNGMDGDLRTGLPEQMINIHDPLRLLITVEQKPEVVSNVIQSDPNLLEWFVNEWVLLLVVDPESGRLFRYREKTFTAYEPLCESLPEMSLLSADLGEEKENINVHLIR